MEGACRLVRAPRLAEDSRGDGWPVRAGSQGILRSHLRFGRRESGSGRARRHREARDMEKLKAPGLGYRKRRSGADVPYWIADARAVKAGYPVKAVNLSVFANEPALLRQRCERLQAEMLLWLSGQREQRGIFDGTFRTLIDRYLTDPESSYVWLRPSS